MWAESASYEAVVAAYDRGDLSNGDVLFHATKNKDRRIPAWIESLEVLRSDEVLQHLWDAIKRGRREPLLYPEQLVLGNILENGAGFSDEFLDFWYELVGRPSEWRVGQPCSKAAWALMYENASMAGLKWALRDSVPELFWVEFTVNITKSQVQLQNFRKVEAQLSSHNPWLRGFNAGTSWDARSPWALAVYRACVSQK